jgi:hypothetical protein
VEPIAAKASGEGSVAHTERERARDRETKRQRDRARERATETDRERERQRDRQRERKRKRPKHTHTHTHKQKERDAHTYERACVRACVCTRTHLPSVPKRRGHVKVCSRAVALRGMVGCGRRAMGCVKTGPLRYIRSSLGQPRGKIGQKLAVHAAGSERRVSSVYASHGLREMPRSWNMVFACTCRARHRISAFRSTGADVLVGGRCAQG